MYIYIYIYIYNIYYIYIIHIFKESNQYLAKNNSCKGNSEVSIS